MTIEAPAKINLGLNIVARRNDGYHNLESLFLPISLADTIDIVPAEGRETTLRVCGRAVEGNVSDNLVIRAARLVTTPPVDITLHKRIPTGAGLGGGSSDAAFTLKALNSLFALGLTNDDMRRMLSSLGADCPFFVECAPQFAEGTGTTLTPIHRPDALDGLHFALIKPSVSVSTREAYMGVRPRPADVPILFALSAPIEEWRDTLRNDFEQSVFAIHPEIGRLKQSLYDAGAVYAQMSGSGSAVFALFRDIPSLPDYPDDYFVWQETL